VEEKLKEVLITYYDDNGNKLSSEVSGAIEGSPMYGLIGTLYNPKEIESEPHTEAAYATMEEVYARDFTAGKIINTLKSLSIKEKKTLIQRALKLTEETGEVAEAVLSYTDSPGCGYKQKTREDVMEECVDVIIMATSIIANLEFKDEDVASTFVKKMTKWEAKMK
jgi:NTP pyrophosphatase (non-canonical NTP hydrolase)